MSQSKKRPCIWPAAVILLVGACGIVLLQRGVYSLTTRPSADLNFLLWGLELSLCLWAMALSNFEPITRVKVVFLLFALQTTGYLAVRIVGFEGDGRAILGLRWNPLPDELFVDDASHESTPTSNRGVRVDPSEWDFPGFRGSDRDGVVAGPQFSLDWESNPPRELWRRPVGVGWSSFAVVGDYCFTQEQRGEFEAVVCYELKTGNEIWDHRAPAYFKEMTGGNGPRATPTFADDRLFALGATGILNCLDPATGTVLWSTNILEDAGIENRLFGMVGSPLVVDGKVFVCPGGPDASVVAYNAETGTRVWNRGSAQASYSSPHYAEFAGRRWVLDFNGEGLTGHQLDGSDQTIWHFDWVSNPSERNNVCQPVLLPAGSPDRGRIFIASGYGKGCVVLEVRSPDGGETFEVTPLWQNRNLKAKFTSVVLHDGFIYGLDERILTCIDVETGKRQWKRGRYGHGQILLVNDVLLLQVETGEIALVEATPDEFREVARFEALHDRTWNHPVVAGRYLLVRNDREAACFELPLTE